MSSVNHVSGDVSEAYSGEIMVKWGMCRWIRV